jgi:phosphate transport system permease protein
MMAFVQPDIPADAMASMSSWWWLVELVLVIVLLMGSAIVVGLVIRGLRAQGEGGGWSILILTVAVALMAGGGLLFMPATGSAETAWFTWVVAAASFVSIVAVLGLGTLGARRLSGRNRDRAFHAFCLSVTGLSVLALVLLLSAIGYLGWRYLSWDLLTSFASRDPEKAGVRAALWGTIWICIVCACTAIPIGVATAMYLEEYVKKGRLYRIIDLNISNLAGVPSIVYGILGLTIFARMFGMLGPINEPSIQVGAHHHASYLSASGSSLSVPLKSRDAEAPVLTDGMTAHDMNGHPVTVKIVPDGTETDHPGAVWASDAAEPVQRFEERAWYYLQLPFGGTVLAGGLTLALVVLPVVIVATREAIRAVPPSLREAALGCGATRLQVIRKVTLPAALPGIMTGSILAVSRAMGEAAPLLVLTGVLFIRFTPQHLMDDFTAMPLQIYNWAGRPQEEFHAVAASGIVVLLVLLLAFNGVAVVIRQYFQKPLQ